MRTGKGIDAQFMQELKYKNDICDVIRSYVALDRKGNTHWACCPFHHEKTPSFAVNEGEQFYHCFGCGVSGDVVKFVQEIESTDFIGAVRILAARAKMEVPEEKFDEEAAARKKQRDRLAKVMLDSARFYLRNLYSGDSRADAHLQYISNRQLSPTTVKKFGLGASLDFKTLPEYLLDLGHQREDMLASGVVSEKNGRLFDSQAGRLIFPIINNYDEVVAFGGRLLEKSDFAKYKNTKETTLFNKSRTLYNINLLKKLKREESINNVIIVEGYMDTISLYQAGFKNVVASMGTSLTKDQARLVKRYTENVLISYDGDFAGQKADLRGLEILKEEHLNVKVVPMPEGLDPDDVVKRGANEYQSCLDKALPLIDYKIHALERKYDLTRTEDKRKFSTEALKVIKSSESESEKEELLKALSKKLNLTYQSLERDMNNIPKEVKTEEVSKDLAEHGISETKSGTDMVGKAIRFVLAAKLFSMPYAKDVKLDELRMDGEVQKIIVEYITAKENAKERIRPSELFDLIDENSPELNEILDLNFGDKLTGEVGQKFFFDSVKTLKKQAIEEKIRILNDRHVAETDTQKRSEIAKEIAMLVIERKKMR